jgi:hypothetical protein
MIGAYVIIKEMYCIYQRVCARCNLVRGAVKGHPLTLALLKNDDRRREKGKSLLTTTSGTKGSEQTLRMLKIVFSFPGIVSGIVVFPAHKVLAPKATSGASVFNTRFVEDLLDFPFSSTIDKDWVRGRLDTAARETLGVTRLVQFAEGNREHGMAASISPGEKEFHGIVTNFA